jgi:hypothetical protein
MIRVLTPILALAYPLQRAGQDLPALSPEPVTLERLPLGQSPFLQRLLSLSPRASFGAFAGTMRLCDFPSPCIVRVRP